MKLPIRISEDQKEPIYHQIEHQLKALIVGGQLPPDTLLPSIRSLSNDLACSVITTRRAYQNLELAGFVKTIQGKGTFVSQMDQRIMSDTKREIVSEALQKAVKEGKQLGCSIEELYMIFTSILKEETREE